MMDERFRFQVLDWAYNNMLKRKGFVLYYAPCAEIVHLGSKGCGRCLCR